MRTVTVLPEGYQEIFSVDLQKNKKTALLINLFALVIGAVMVAAMQWIVPIATLFDMSQGLKAYTIRFAVMIGLLVLYIVLHELTHGVAMKLCGTKKIRYGFTGMYAYAGSDDYYGKKSYIFIALAPVVLWGAVLAIVNLLVPVQWIWVIYMVQISNLSGAAGDAYVTWKFSRFPADILVRDSGVGMTVYSKERIENHG